MPTNMNASGFIVSRGVSRLRWSEERSQLVCVPAGYANCLKAQTDGAVMLVLSDKTLDEALGDSWRYDASMWVDWSKY